MLKRYHTLDLAILLVLGVAGYVGASLFFIALAAVGLSVQDLVKLLQQHASKVALTSKSTTYVMTGLLANAFYATLAYMAGGLAAAGS